MFLMKKREFYHKIVVVKSLSQQKWRKKMKTPTKSKIARWIQIRWDLRASTKACLSNFDASNLEPPQVPCTDRLMNTENDYVYWKQVEFLLFDWSATVKPWKRKMIFP